jgi:hypothetical protein
MLIWKEAIMKVALEKNKLWMIQNAVNSTRQVEASRFVTAGSMRGWDWLGLLGTQIQAGWSKDSA